jgi:hypothetical protein
MEYVIAPVPNTYPIKENVTVCGITGFLEILLAI